MRITKDKLQKLIRLFVASIALLNGQHVLGAGATTQTTINTSHIVSQTLSAMSCLKYKVVGICLWLRCGFHGCSVETSIKVGHYNPDLVVSSYPKTGSSPWVETQSYSASLSLNPFPYDLQGGADSTATNGGSNQHVATKFMEVDAIGNPALAATYLLSGTGYMCSSSAIPMVPYHLSSADALNWRFASLEMLYPASLIPGMREIGHFPFNTWGAVYPRTGFTTSNEHPKSAAVTAQRSGDIVTRSWQPHIYWPVGSNCGGNGMKCWAPGALIEGEENTGKWQMLKPQALSSCEVFGKNDTLSLNSWANNKEDQHGDYAWNLWRPYSCCEKEGQVFLGSTGSYP